MFSQLFKRQSLVRRHENAPFLEERLRYLTHCAQRGDSHTTLLIKARELLWVARKLNIYGDLPVNIEQIQAVAHGWRAREHACGQRLATRWTRLRFVTVARAWLRSLGYLRRPVEPLPFEHELEAYCQWARDERGLQESTIDRARFDIATFLRWYGKFERSFQDICVDDVDVYARESTSVRDISS